MYRCGGAVIHHEGVQMLLRAAGSATDLSLAGGVTAATAGHSSLYEVTWRPAIHRSPPVATVTRLFTPCYTPITSSRHGNMTIHTLLYTRHLQNGRHGNMTKKGHIWQWLLDAPFYLCSIDLTFHPKVSPPKYRLLATFGPESLPKCFRCLVKSVSIIKGRLGGAQSFSLLFML